MEVGCGIQVRRVKGRRYLYFWRYERTNGRSVKRWKYLGVAGRTETRRKALQELTIHYSRVKRDIDRKLAIAHARLYSS